MRKSHVFAIRNWSHGAPFAVDWNAALARARGELACWLGTDNPIDSPERANLRVLVDRMKTIPGGR
jgi:hypothetical protein